MENKKVGPFEELGRKFDEILRAYSPGRYQTRPAEGQKLENELFKAFSNAANLKIERENVENAHVDDILTWVKSKLPLYGVAKAHVINAVREGRINLYIVFSDSANHAFLDGSLPMKHIICNRIDEGLVKFFNGLSIATIEINQ